MVTVLDLFERWFVVEFGNVVEALEALVVPATGEKELRGLDQEE